jgi:hypothetical protein
MPLIDLPFSERMKQALLSGRKSCTTRRTRKGDPGDWFEIDGETFRILDVHEAPLRMVRDVLYRLEGCTSPNDFECVWRSLHDGVFPGFGRVHVHFFTRFPIPDEIIAADMGAREAERVAAESGRDD